MHPSSKFLKKTSVEYWCSTQGIVDISLKSRVSVLHPNFSDWAFAQSVTAIKI